MSFEEKLLICADCGKEFPFTVEEQEFFASKGFTNEPKRCTVCRQSRRRERYGSSSSSSNRQMYTVICADCGKETEVPFQPRGDRPVYCRECYVKNK